MPTLFLSAIRSTRLLVVPALFTDVLRRSCAEKVTLPSAVIEALPAVMMAGAASTPLVKAVAASVAPGLAPPIAVTMVFAVLKVPLLIAAAMAVLVDAVFDKSILTVIAFDTRVTVVATPAPASTTLTVIALPPVPAVLASTVRSPLKVRVAATSVLVRKLPSVMTVYAPVPASMTPLTIVFVGGSINSVPPPVDVAPWTNVPPFWL